MEIWSSWPMNATTEVSALPGFCDEPSRIAGGLKGQGQGKRNIRTDIFL